MVAARVVGGRLLVVIAELTSVLGAEGGAGKRLIAGLVAAQE